VDPSDVVQNGHADCFLMAGMAALVQQHPNAREWMERVIKDNKDGSYTVTFWELKTAAHLDPFTFQMVPAEYAPREVTVAGELANAAHSDDGGEKWPAIIESAYAQAYGGPGEKPFAQRDNLGDSMERLTGIPSKTLDSTQLSIDQLDRYMADKYAITVQTLDKPISPLQEANTHPAYVPGGLSESNPRPPTPMLDDSHQKHNEQLRPWHEYYVRGVDKESNTVIVNNVWDQGREDIRIPFDQFKTAFEAVKVNPVYARPDTL
jgi:hypothetical protein